MQKHFTKFLLLAVLLVGGLIAAKSPAEPKQYEYVTLLQEYDRLLVSTSAGKYESTDTKMKMSTRGNYIPLFAKVAELEAQGYELVENNFAAAGPGGYPLNYVLLRKLK